MKKNSVIIIYSVAALFLISCTFVIFTFAYSSFENISVMGFKSRLDEYNKKEKEFLALEATYKEWKKIDKIYAKFKDDYLIEFNEYPNFRNELQSFLVRNSLQLVDMKPKYKNLMEDIREVSLDITLIGSYVNIKKFIFEMENKNKMVLFKNFQFDKKDANNVYAKISLEAYFVR